MRIIRSRQVIFALVSGIVTLSACNAQEPAKPQADEAKPASGTDATVNGVAIPPARLEFLVKARGSQVHRDSSVLRKALH